MNQIELVLILWIGLICFVTSADVPPPGGFYQTRYDAVDVDDVLNHKRLVHHYAACLVNRGPCPPQGADLKRILPEALENNCLRCTEKQKHIALITIHRLRMEYPTLWREIVDFWDPSEERLRRFEQSLNKTSSVDNSQNNALFDRFNEVASQNDLAAPIRPSSVAPPVKPPSIAPPYPSASSPFTFSTTVRSTATSSSTTPSVSSSTTRRSTTSRTTTTRTTKQDDITFSPTTKPPRIFYRPLSNLTPLDLPTLKARLFGDFTKVVKYGTEVAGMVLQAFVGQN